MVYTTAQYGFLRQTYKTAETEIYNWITALSPPNPSGQQHCYSYLGKLAQGLFKQRVEMPKELREKLIISLEIRIDLVAHHTEQGDADLGHEFPIELFGKIARLLFPVEELPNVTRVLQSASAKCGRSFTEISRRTPSPPAAINTAVGVAPTRALRWQSSGSWRSKSEENVPRLSSASWRQSANNDFARRISV